MSILYIWSKTHDRDFGESGDFNQIGLELDIMALLSCF